MKKEHILLIILFLFTLTFRLYFVLSTDAFSGGSAYNTIENVEYLTENSFKPMLFDKLSYGGRPVVGDYFFYYFLLIFYWISPLLAFKIIPELLLASLVFLVYLISYKVTKNASASLFSAFLSSLIPILVSETINRISVFSLVLPLMLIAIYLFFDLKKNALYFLLSLGVLVLTHPTSMILSLSLVFYLALLNLDSKKIKSLQREIIVPSIFLTILVNLIIFKKAISTYGVKVIFQNIPAQLLSQWFKNLSILDIFFNIGIVHLIFGIIGYTIACSHLKKDSVYFLNSMTIVIFLLLLFRLLPWPQGLIFLGLLMSIFSAVAFDKFFKYFSLTKFSRYKNLIIFSLISFVFLVQFSSMVYTLSLEKENIITPGEIEALSWIKDNTPPNATVLGDISEGTYITYFARRKNVADENYLLAPNRYDDIIHAFTLEEYLKFKEIQDKYDINYVYLSKRTLKNYNLQNLKCLNKCFKEGFKNEAATVYKIVC